MATTSAHPAEGLLDRVRTAGPPRPRPVPLWWRDASGAGFWALLLVVTALWVSNGGLQDLGGIASGLTSASRITGLIGSALLLVQVLLMARVPWFEQAWGQDDLARLHRIVGFTSFSLVLAHVVLVTLGYAAASPQGVIGTFVDLTLHYPGMLIALAGTLAIVMVALTSIKAARRRLRYESWHLLHLYAYLGAGLALPHQLWTGQEFLLSTASTVFWWTLYATSVGAVLLYRVVVPLWRSARLGLRVTRVHTERKGVTTVTVAGPGLAHLPVRAGQFFQCRFLDGPGWTRAHPYSLSAAPDGRSLSFTVAEVGDGTRRLARMKPGTRVLIEGPYGRLHAGVRTRRKVLLMGSGIGITPLKAILEDLDQAPGEVTVVHRVRARSEAVFARELSRLAAARGARYLLVEGPRLPDRPSWLPAQARHLADAAALRELVGDISDHDVYICGSLGWMDAAEAAVRDAGVPPRHIHLERFSY